MVVTGDAVSCCACGIREPVTTTLSRLARASSSVVGVVGSGVAVPASWANAEPDKAQKARALLMVLTSSFRFMSLSFSGVYGFLT